MKAAEPMVPASLRGLLDRLARAGVPQEFYLAGGTGLALLVQHRRSVDLALFSRTNRLDFEGRRALLARIGTIRGWRQLEVRDGTVHGRVGQVRVSLFWYPVPLLKPLIRDIGIFTVKKGTFQFVKTARWEEGIATEQVVANTPAAG